MVKQEFIPEILPERRLIRESCSFFPLPQNCRKTHDAYQMNRKLFYKRELRKLNARGFEKTKAFIREDGMVIEWKSPVPVWSDTLEPEAATTIEHVVGDRMASGSLNQPSASSSTTSALPVQSTPEEVAETAKLLAINFITRYLDAFDNNRASISSAYAKNAVFSYRAISAYPSSKVELFVPKNKPYFPTSRLAQGRSAIVDTLSGFGPYQFGHPTRGVVDLVYDVVTTPLEAGGDILLVFNTEVVKPSPTGDHYFAVSQSFVLIRHERLQQASSLVEDEWPVAAVSHQMTVREGRLDYGVGWSI